MERKNRAAEAELQRLIAEQADDDKAYVSQWERSLDAPMGEDDGGSLHDLVAEQEVDAGPARKGPRGRVTGEQIKEWRSLRNKDHWTYAQIAEYAGVQVKTVRDHISRWSKYEREGIPKVELLERLGQFQAAYEAGASMREIAELHYEELGYQTWESCYQQLRIELKRSGTAVRWRTLKHGMRSVDAPLEVQRRYQRERQRERSQAGLTRCDAVVRSGRPCRRWAITGSRYCMCHDERTRSSASQRKWTKDNVLEAFRVWADEHGRPPKATDWAKAADGHPTFKTVTDLFGKWNLALHEAGLRKMERRDLEREARLAEGHKECAQPGCTVLVAPSRHYCRNRQCQDARFRASQEQQAA